jgi:hypothetical protein
VWGRLLHLLCQSTFEELFLGKELHNQKELMEVMQHLASSQRAVVLTVVTEEMESQVEFWALRSSQNLMYSLYAVGRAPNVLLISDSQQVCLQLWKASVPCYLDKYSQSWLASTVRLTPRSVDVVDTVSPR